MATLYSISEQVSKMLEGADPSSKTRFAMTEIKRYIIQVANSMIKSQHFTEEMAAGAMIPDGSVLTEYDNVAVVPYKGLSRAMFPIMPVKLPLGIGVYHISKTDDIINGFIPFEPGELQMIGEEPLISDVLGQIAYEPREKYALFNKNILLGDSQTKIDKVYMLLVVKDLSLYGDWDLLPISSSIESDLIMATFQMLSGQNTQNKKVDVINKQPEAVQ